MSKSFFYSYIFHCYIFQYYYMTLFTLFLLVAINVAYVNSIRFKHIYSLCHFLELNYKGLNLNFLILKQLLIDSDIESNPRPTQNVCNSPVGRKKKIKLFKKIENCFFCTIKTVSLEIIKPWSVTCPSTLQSFQKLESEVNSSINSKDLLCQGDITELNIDVILDSTNKSLTDVAGIDEAIYEATGPALLGECQKLNNFETLD